MLLRERFKFQVTPTGFILKMTELYSDTHTVAPKIIQQGLFLVYFRHCKRKSELK
jgi:hypothetical protein